MDQILPGERESPFGKISYEMVLDILEYLSHQDKKKCRLVCHRWRILLDNCHRYFLFRPKLNNKSITAFLNSYRPIDQVMLQNTTQLEIPWTNPHFQFLREAILGWRNSEQNIIQFFKFCQDSASVLTITKFSLGEISQAPFHATLQELTWSNLNKMNLTIMLTKYKLPRAQAHMENSAILLRTVKFPSLKEFKLDFAHKNSNHRRDDAFQNICLGLYEFISNHASSLKSLIIGIRVLKNLRKFQLPEIPTLLQESMKLNLKLERYSLAVWGVRRTEQMLSPCIVGRNLLTFELYLDPGNFDNRKKIPRKFDFGGTPEGRWFIDEKSIEQLFRANGKFLRNFTISHINDEYKRYRHPDPEIYLEIFASCTALETIAVKHPYILNDSHEFPTPIFEASLNSLRSVEMELRNLELSWFRNCVQLESLNVNAMDDFDSWNTDPFQENDKLPPMRLKKLVINVRSFLKRDHNLRFLQEFIDRSGATLEILDLHYIHHDTFSLSLGSCFALKYVRTFLSLENSIGLTSALNFAHLAEIETVSECFTDPFQNWVIDTMKNLERIGEIDFDFPFMQRLLELPKMKEMRLDPHMARWHEAAITEFLQRKPGMTTKIEFDGYEEQVFCILVDRTVNQ